MKCIKCNKDAKKRDRDAYGGKCPSCKHRFVTEPAKDSLTDMAVQTAENLVSSNDTFYFLKNHLKYQLLRRTRKKIKWWAWFTSIALLCLAASAAFLVRGGTWVFIVISMICLLIALARKSGLNKTIARLNQIIIKWEQINPNGKLLMAKDSPVSQNVLDDRKDLEAISFERVLICDRNEYVDFFLANLFHFHYSCPVLGGNKYPKQVCADMLRRLKNNRQLDVFLLHDYTPEGYAFANRIKSDPYWFGKNKQFNIVDLGLLKEQRSLFKSLLIKQKNMLKSSGAYQRYRPEKKIAELTVFRPETLMSLCGMAINEKVPLHKVSLRQNNSSDGYG